jgi:hypothetical protein
MGKTLAAAVFIFMMFLGFGVAHAAPLPLVDNGGGLIYDPNLNITWYNYVYYDHTSSTQGQGATWAEATAWVSSLNAGGVTGWRLPHILPVNGSTYNDSDSCDGSTDFSYNISAPGSAYPGTHASEMAYLYYWELGNLGYEDVNCNWRSSGAGLVNAGLLTRLKSYEYYYWSDQPYDTPGAVRDFLFDGGAQAAHDATAWMYAIAVHDGDVMWNGVALPNEPAVPTVTSTSPSPSATNVPAGSAITATFNTAMNAATITTSTFTLSKGVTGTVTYDPSTMTATFTPSAPLAYNTTYTATITTGVENSAEQGLSQAYAWSFTTASAIVLPLSSGWNLISLPVQPPDTTISTVLSGLNGSYDVAWGYPSQSWEFYDPNNRSGSTLTTMQAGIGYWIGMTSTGTLIVSGSTPSSSLSLLEGWNLVGYSGSACATASKALSSLGTALQVAWGYPGQAWEVYDPNDPAGSTLTQFCPNNGYWVKVSQSRTWTPPLAYTYVYTGGYFDDFGLLGNNGVGTNNRITITVTFPEGLPANGTVVSGPGSSAANGTIQFPLPVSFTFSDGVHSITQADASGYIFQFTTSGGAISQWACQAWNGIFLTNGILLNTANPPQAIAVEAPTEGDISVNMSNPPGTPTGTGLSVYAVGPSGSWSLAP